MMAPNTTATTATSAEAAPSANFPLPDPMESMSRHCSTCYGAFITHDPSSETQYCKPKCEEESRQFFAFLDKAVGTKIDTLNLPELDTQIVINLLQTALHLPRYATSRRRIRKMVLKLSLKYSKLPASLFLKDVTCSIAESHSSGSFADIYSGEYRGQRVALKRLRVFQMIVRSKREELIRAFYHESLIWKNLDHHHILPFLGIDDTIFPPSLCMVLPWMDLGNIRDTIDHMKTTMSDCDSIVQILIWISDIPSGLDYLHTEGIVHGDLRGANILIDHELRLRLADFGLAVFAEGASREYGSVRGGNARWLAPELIHPELFSLTSERPTYAGDTFAFGCVCVELCTGQTPYFGVSDHQVIARVPLGLRPSRPAFRSETPIPDSLWSIIQRCWDQSASKRPSANVLVEATKELWRPQTAQNVQIVSLLQPAVQPPLDGDQLSNEPQSPPQVPHGLSVVQEELLPTTSTPDNDGAMATDSQSHITPGTTMGAARSVQMDMSGGMMAPHMGGMNLLGMVGIGRMGGMSGLGSGNGAQDDVLMTVSEVNVTTPSTADAGQKRRKQLANFACPVPGCGSTFTRHFNLKGHLRSHREEKPYQCKWPGCGKGFARQHDYKRHEQFHLNIRPFPCEGCKKNFARMDALNRHLQSEGGAGCRKLQELMTLSGTEDQSASKRPSARVLVEATQEFRGPQTPQDRLQVESSRQPAVQSLLQVDGHPSSNEPQPSPQVPFSSSIKPTSPPPTTNTLDTDGLINIGPQVHITPRTPESPTGRMEAALAVSFLMDGPQTVQQSDHPEWKSSSAFNKELPEQSVSGTPHEPGTESQATEQQRSLVVVTSPQSPLPQFGPKSTDTTSDFDFQNGLELFNSDSLFEEYDPADYGDLLHSMNTFIDEFMPSLRNNSLSISTTPPKYDNSPLNVFNHAPAQISTSRSDIPRPLDANLGSSLMNLDSPSFLSPLTAPSWNLRRARTSSSVSSVTSAVRTSPYPSPSVTPKRLGDLGTIGTGASVEPFRRGQMGVGSRGDGGSVPVHASTNRDTITDGEVPRTVSTKDASTSLVSRKQPNFICPVLGCGSTFTRHFNLKGHLRSHAEEKPYQCKWPGCGKGFARQHDCKRHEQLHLNLRPFPCEGCKKNFARMDALERHLRSEGGAECRKMTAEPTRITA